MLSRQKHVEYIRKIIKERDILYFLTEQDRVATLFWAMNSLRILKDPFFEEMKPFAIKYLISCLKMDGGFGPTKEYTSNLVSTFHALQIFFIMNVPFYSCKTVEFICSLQNSEGAFMNDRFGELDTRIDCCAILSLHLLSIMKDFAENNIAFSDLDLKFFRDVKNPYDSMDWNDFSDLNEETVDKIKRCCSSTIHFPRERLSSPIPKGFLSNTNLNINLFVRHILACNNSDGGFGQLEGSESHSAQIFCCVSILRSLAMLDKFDQNNTIDFLVYRQNKTGGFSGRVNKKEDVCYSFWAYSSLLCLGSKDDIDTSALKKFILSCQGPEGGFSDRPGNMCDLYHLMFSLASLRLLGDETLDDVDPGFAM